jgi:hypothetical protein
VILMCCFLKSFFKCQLNEKQQNLETSWMSWNILAHMQ